MKRRLGVACALIATACVTSFAQHRDAGLLVELLALSDSDEFMARAPETLLREASLVGWRLYDTRDSLEFLFEATNESLERIVVDQLRLRDGIKLTMSDGH